MQRPAFKDYRDFWLWCKAGGGKHRDNSEIREVMAASTDEFERTFKDAVSRNYFIEIADDFDTAAFLIVNGDGAARYSIPLAAYLNSIVNRAESL